MQTLCTNHARNEIGVLTVCHSEQPNLVQNKFFMWRFFWFGIIHNKDKHWEGLNRGSLGKIKWNIPFFLSCQHGVSCSVQCSDLNHETANYTLISWATSTSRHSEWHSVIIRNQTTSRHSEWHSVIIRNQTTEKRHRTNLIWQRYGCSLWQTVSPPISFLAWLVHNVCIWALHIPSCIHNRDIPKKVPQKYPVFMEKYFLRCECEKFQKSAKMLIKCRQFSWARWYRTHDTKQGNTVVKMRFSHLTSFPSQECY